MTPVGLEEGSVLENPSPLMVQGQGWGWLRRSFLKPHPEFVEGRGFTLGWAALVLRQAQDEGFQGRKECSIIGPMNLLRRLVERFSAWNNKPRPRSAKEVAGLLRAVANDTANPGKVDGFIYIPISDPVLERIRDNFGAMYGPGFDRSDPKFTQLMAEAEALASR